MALNPGSPNGRKEDEVTQGCFETGERNSKTHGCLKKVQLGA